MDWAALADTAMAFLSNPLTSPELVDEPLQRLEGPRGSCYVNQICTQGKQRPLLRFSVTQLR
jgi:hypothetical protein